MHFYHINNTNTTSRKISQERQRQDGICAYHLHLTSPYSNYIKIPPLRGKCGLTKARRSFLRAMRNASRLPLKATSISTSLSGRYSPGCCSGGRGPRWGWSGVALDAGSGKLLRKWYSVARVVQDEVGDGTQTFEVPCASSGRITVE